MAHVASSEVSRLYVTSGVCYIRLRGIANPPLNEYFRLNQGHPNYNALYSLALAAAINGYELTIRTVGEIVPTETAQVQYLVVDW